MQAAVVPEPIFNVPYFDQVDASLSINVTDTTRPRKPPYTMVELAKGVKKYYRMERPESSTSRHWRTVIATELVHKFLLKDPERKRTYILTNFPDGYYLYSHNVTTKRKNINIEEDKGEIRGDAYLYGGGKKFRSPNEALRHFAWIMHGMDPNRCRCTHCTPDKSKRRKQGVINKELDASWSKYLNDKQKKNYEESRERRQNNMPYVPPEPTVNIFNEEMFLPP